MILRKYEMNKKDNSSNSGFELSPFPNIWVWALTPEPYEIYLKNFTARLSY